MTSGIAGFPTADSQETTAVADLWSKLRLTDMKIFCPVPLRIHPYGAAELDAHGTRWLRSQGVPLPEASGQGDTRLGHLFSAGMPYTTEDFLTRFICFNYWGILWDDHLDALAPDLAAVTAHVGEASRIQYEPGGVPVPDDLRLRVLRAALEVLRPGLSPEAWQMFCAAALSWYQGQVWKYALQHRSTPPGLGEWLRMRWAKLGTSILAAMTCPGAGQPASSAMLAEPAVRAFTHATFLAPAMLNELGSLTKESPTGQSTNLVLLLARTHRVGVTEAALQVWELYERLVGLMLRLRTRLLADPRPAVAHYAKALPHWLPATLEWHLTSSRYRAAAPAAEPAPAPAAEPGPAPAPRLVLTDTPTLWDPDDHTPPPVPELAWMWRQTQP
ncbi:hypothetical protein ABT354_17875 [Streptomyces sp. NPDC000594]|uniref:terpene synthase family protein n=1 Tax=Streptomyces sp. NPDC000594 TaxID=3154261 RepID=UPI00331AAF19